MQRAIIALLILTPAAGAQTIYTCRPATGPVSYQTQPCTASQTQLKTKLYPYIRDLPAPPAETRARPRAYQSPTGDASPAPAMAAQRPSDRTLQRQECSSTKDARARAFEAAGLNRTFDLSRQWDDAVYHACKGL
jgi:hypothetical protein